MKIGNQDIQLKAIFSGTLFDIVGTLIFGSIFTFIAAIPYSNADLSPAEIELQLRGSLFFQTLNIVNGFFFTSMGGYIAARIAKRALMKHAVLTGAASIAIAVIFVALIPEASLRWYDMITLLLMLPAAALGGRIRQTHIRKEPPCTQDTLT